MKYLNRIPGLDLEGIANGTVKAEDVAGLIEFVGRTLDLAPANAFVDEAMKRFGATKPEASDAWLAPRFHYAFRVHRREAADNRLFWHLALVWRPDYVKWRFGGTSGAVTDDRSSARM